MKTPLAMALFSRRPLTTAIAREQITALSDFRGGLMRPDKCSEYEPIRRPFDASDISKPIEWLASTGGVFLYRKGKPIQVSGVMWNLSRSPTARFPTPPFSNYWTGRVAHSSSSENPEGHLFIRRTGGPHNCAETVRPGAPFIRALFANEWER